MTDTKLQAGESIREKEISLDDARLQMGDPVQLQYRSGDTDVRYSVRLIGMSKGRSVLVSTPMMDGKYLLLRDGEAFVLRAFSGKNAFAFPTRIIKSVNTPYPYLHLEYPREVRSLVVRRGARVSVKVICAIAVCETGLTEEAGTILNLSIGGALVATKQSIAEKEQHLILKFKVEVNGVEILQELKTIVRAITLDHSGETSTPFHYGVQFVDISPDDSIPLLAYVYHELLEQSLGG